MVGAREMNVMLERVMSREEQLKSLLEGSVRYLDFIIHVHVRIP